MCNKMRLSLSGFQRGKRKGRNWSDPPRGIATGLGARVARLRCPILRAGLSIVAESDMQSHPPLVARKAKNARTSAWGGQSTHTKMQRTRKKSHPLKINWTMSLTIYHPRVWFLKKEQGKLKRFSIISLRV